MLRIALEGSGAARCLGARAHPAAGPAAVTRGIIPHLFVEHPLRGPEIGGMHRPATGERVEVLQSGLVVPRPPGWALIVRSNINEILPMTLFKPKKTYEASDDVLERKGVPDFGNESSHRQGLRAKEPSQLKERSPLQHEKD